jgi:uncharacterized protein with HEPN domain
MKDDRIYIEHIIQSIGRIETYLNGKDHQDFTDDLMTQVLLFGSWKLLAKQLKGYQKSYET